MFQLDRDTPERGLLHGFRCDIVGPAPSSPFEADDRVREKALGLPSKKGQGSFTFPQDFSDAPADLQDLHDGDYTVYWTAWAVEEGAPRIDAGRDSFHVTRAGHVE